MSDHDDVIAALLREREGYVQYKKTDRVEAVDAELKRLGYKAPDGRSSRSARQQTAD